MKFLVSLLVFTVALVVVCAGPEAEDEKWEDCNDKQDSGLAHLGNTLNSTESYDMDGSDPCKTCKVWYLGTVKRTADTHFEEVKENTLKHEMKVGFGFLRVLCDCVAKSGAKDVEGQLLALWTEPRIEIEMIANVKEETTNFENSMVACDMDTTCEQECQGSDEWKDKCENMKSQRVFNPSIKNAVERLFPVQSTNKVRDDKDLMKKLIC